MKITKRVRKQSFKSPAPGARPIGSAGCTASAIVLCLREDGRRAALVSASGQTILVLSGIRQACCTDTDTRRVG